MSQLMDAHVDWTGWSENADARTCPACGETFQPNHPRRRFCGTSTCPGRKRRRSPASTPSPQPRTPRRARRKTRAEASQLAALFADAMLEIHRASFTGTREDVVNATVALCRCTNPAAERALTVRLLAAAAARVSALNPPGAISP